MKTWRLVLFSCMALLLLCLRFVSDVSAQATDTPTPTATLTPTPDTSSQGWFSTATPEPTWTVGPTPTIHWLYSTPTVEPVRGTVVCPVGTPDGFGLVTPSARWLYTCQQCIPAAYGRSTVTPVPLTLYPTMTSVAGLATTVPITWVGWLTATATPGPTATPTATPIPQNLRLYSGSVDCAGGGSGSGSWLFDRYGCIDLDMSAPSGEAEQYWTVCHTDPFTATVDATVSIVWYGDSRLEFYGLGPGGESTTPYRFLIRAGSYDYYPSSVLYSGPWISWGAGAWGKTTFRWYHGGNASLTGSVCFNGAVPEGDELTPTPSPTPVLTSTPEGIYSDFCDSVESWDDAGGIGDMPGFKVGTTSCYGIGGFEFDMAGTVIAFPDVSICFDRIEFGVLSILGVSIDADWLAAFAVGVLLVRWLLRS